MAGEDQTPYQALYRRFRPQRFADVLGQGHVTRALQAAVRDDKVAHAYLFSGPRGTGKTSTARILAMALNCENPSDGEPCGECRSCVAIRTGSSLDVQELDSATNRGIDEMRDLLSRVALGTPGRWKVYIVDEVHQITSAAASALLKTLEEPPGHVIFVLATTDPQKVLDTIRSRTQHFEFRLLGSEVLAGLLSDVAHRADIDLTPEAIDVVVRRGHGSARDALSALDQVAAAGTVEDDSSLVSELVDAVIDRDAGAVLVKVAEAVQSGLDARRLGAELLEHLRNGFLATRARNLVLLSDEGVAAVEAQAAKLGAAALVRAMELIGQALIDMRDAADARTTLEVALVRLAAPEADDSRGALLERIERLERAVAGGAGPAAAEVVGAPSVPQSGTTPRSGAAPQAGAAPQSGATPQPAAPSAPAASGSPAPPSVPGTPGASAPAGTPAVSAPPGTPAVAAPAGTPGASATPGTSAVPGAPKSPDGPPSPGPAPGAGSRPAASPSPAPGVPRPSGRPPSRPRPGGQVGATPAAAMGAAPSVPSRGGPTSPPGPAANEPTERAPERGPSDPVPSGPGPNGSPGSGSRSAPAGSRPAPPGAGSVPSGSHPTPPGVGSAAPASESRPAPTGAASAPPSSGPRSVPPGSGSVPPGVGSVPPRVGSAPTSPRAVPDPPGATPDTPAAGGRAPSREELTMAWGDGVLPSLRPAVKVYVANGRFLVSSDDAAIYAVPDRGLLQRAENNRAEVEHALSKHFGRPVRLKLVLDDEAKPAGGRGGPSAPEPTPEPEEDWAEMMEAPAASTSPEQRLMEAFPGAEEVQ
ncbi:MAG TPA: DNA polymerase III subunit gamma/tau [Acidimicrobiales bacterium]|nr:DNA polymerase III subunit gamma/tau [Acidimicrobiales bacterium]